MEIDPLKNSIMTSINTNSTDPMISIIQPNQVNLPIYHFHRPEVVPGLNDSSLTLIVPLLTYWSVSILFMALESLEITWIEKYRLHEPEAVKRRNRVTPHQVIKAVLVQQALQTALGIAYLDSSPSTILDRDYLAEMKPFASVISILVRIIFPPKHALWILTRYGQQATQWSYWWGLPILQLIGAAFILDTWQYFWHRGFHINRFLYKHIHSVHHRLYCPYAFGALYNHPVEGFILDTLGAAIAHCLSGMSVRQAALFFAISTAKTVDDHCGLALPFDPLQVLFGNNASYHDIHHQQFGIKRNFSQPYFFHWDVLMGTRMTVEEAQSKYGPSHGRDPSSLTNESDEDTMDSMKALKNE